jgi:hypothetical protein
MKQLSILTMTMIALSGFMATTVRAQNPHYITGPTASLVNGTDYSVTFKEAGLGSSPVTYTLKAGAGSAFTYQCFTKSGNNPQGAPNSVDASNLTTVTTITPHNGSVSATISMAPDANPPLNICRGGGLVLRLVGVDYDNVTFSDGISAAVALPDMCSGSGCP